MPYQSPTISNDVSIIVSLREVIMATELLTPVEAAKILRVTAKTLGLWRCLRRYDLPYVKAGRHVRYKLTDIEKFIAARTRPGIAEVSVPARRGGRRSARLRA
jgi:excisionase family DNA binding protein